MDIAKGLLILPRFLLSRRIRGGNRIARLLAYRFPSLQSYQALVPGGSIFVDLRSIGGQQYIREICSNEEHLIIAKCVRSDDVAYDIGANVGLYSVWLSSLVGHEGKVFAFEPNPAHAERLAKTLGLWGNAKVFNLGLSDHEGEFDLYVPENDTMASLMDWTDGEGGNVRKETCKVTTLDHLFEEGMIPKPQFIKCDIEGGEVDCFRGAGKVLDAEDAPIILFEANINSTRGFGNSISSAMDFLVRLDKPGYRFYLVNEGASLKPIESVNFLHGNILAVPTAHIDRVAGPHA